MSHLDSVKQGVKQWPPTHALKETQHGSRRIPLTYNKDQQSQRSIWGFQHSSPGHLSTLGYIWPPRLGSFEAGCCQKLEPMLDKSPQIPTVNVLTNLAPLLEDLTESVTPCVTPVCSQAVSCLSKRRNSTHFFLFFLFSFLSLQLSVSLSLSLVSLPSPISFISINSPLKLHLHGVFVCSSPALGCHLLPRSLSCRIITRTEDGSQSPEQ